MGVTAWRGGDHPPPRVFPELGCVGYPEQQQRRCEVVQYVEVFLDAGAVQREPIRRQEQLQEPMTEHMTVTGSSEKLPGLSDLWRFL